LTTLKTIGVSEIRKNMADYFVEAVYKNQLVTLSRYEKEKAFLMGETMLDLLLKPTVNGHEINVRKEEDGSYTLKYEPLNLLVNNETYEAASEDLVSLAKDYTAEYLENIDIYMRDQKRKEQLALVILIAKANNPDEIKNLLGITKDLSKKI